MALDVVLGLQRGDEGKGRIVDLFAEKYDVVARFNGGANAGHTVVPEGLKPIALHQLPSGISYPGKLNIVGNGVYLDPIRLIEELEEVKNASIIISKHNLLISSSAHLVMPHHKLLDALREKGSKAQGSTKAGIAFVASSKYLRSGLRVENILSKIEELRQYASQQLNDANRLFEKNDRLKQPALKKEIDDWIEASKKLRPYIGDSVEAVNRSLHLKLNVLAEGAQAFWLDIDHGMYPHTTSSHTSIGGVLNGLGISHKHLGKITGVAKVIKSHVGGGPFVTKITDDKLASQIRGKKGDVDSEYGATTKRARHVGCFDLVELRSAINICGIDELVLTKMDCVSKYGKTMKVALKYEFKGKLLNHAPSSSEMLENCRPVYTEMATWGDISNISDFKDLPKEAQSFVAFVEKSLGIPVTILGVGPERNQVIFKKARSPTG